MGFLDYYLKSYLNGSYLEESILLNWDGNVKSQ